MNFVEKVFKNFCCKFSLNVPPFFFRRKRFKKFVKRISLSESSRILDVGGTESMWNIHNNNSNITLINLDFGKKEKKFSYIIGDACIMPFINNSFDVIFSNSVIEHVGDFDRQKSFAKEINRIGKKHWVQTPYKHFPLEPHFLFPFFQYFPLSFKVWIALKWPFSFIKINKSDPVKEAKEIRLLNIKEFKELFPNSNIIKEKFWGLTKSLIAYSSEN